MSADELLLQAIAADLTVALDRDRIVVRPKGQISDELRAAIAVQRDAVVVVLVARASMAARQAALPPRLCVECEELHAGVYCVDYQMTIPEPSRPCRCARFEQRKPDVPWT